MSIAVLHISPANFARSDHLSEDIAIAKALAINFDNVYIFTSPELPDKLKTILDSIAEIVLWDRDVEVRVRWLRCLPRYYAEAINGQAVFYKRPTRLAVSGLKRYMSAYARLREIAPSVLVTTLVGKDHPLIVAANSLDIPTVGVQHAPYYHRFREKARPYEWPVAHIAVWNREVLKFCIRKFPGQAKFFSMDSPLWTVREPAVGKSDSRVFIYESTSTHSLMRIAKSLFQNLGAENIAFKAHPNLHVRGRSLARKFPGRRIFDDINDLIPLFGISFGSTVTDQLIRRGVPCVTIIDSHGFDEMVFPRAGTFSTGASSESEIISFVLRLYLDRGERHKLWKAQAEERRRFGIFMNNGVERIANHCRFLGEARNINEASS